MPPARPLPLAPEWDSRYARMIAVSAAAHMAIVAAVVVLAPYMRLRPLPPMAYTVELTDSRALGGRLPPGPFTGELGGPQKPAAPEPKGQPEAVAKAPEPPPAPATPPEPQPPPKAAEPEPPPKPPEQQVAKAEAPPVTIPEKAPEPKPEPKPEAKPEPKPEPKPAAKPPEPAKPAPVARPPEPPAPRAENKPATKAPAAKPPEAAAKPGSPAGREESPRHDAYSAAAERWRSRAGGLGGRDTGSGPVGVGGQGPGGGGKPVGLEFLAYYQQVKNAVHANWINVLGRAGLVAVVRFQIAPDGSVSDARLVQSSGNSAYDAAALRAVQRTTQLPPPPAAYADEFRETEIDFKSEEPGGSGQG